MARTRICLAACLCVAALVAFFGCTSSPVYDVASSLQAKHAGHSSKENLASDLKSDLKEPQPLPQRALAQVLPAGGSLAGGATSKEAELNSIDPKRSNGAWPLMFCWSLMQFGGYEETLIKFQLQGRSSIFACNGFAVVSTERKYIGTMDGGDVFTWANSAKNVTKGQYGVEVDGSRQTTNSWLNTATFHQAWDTLMRSKHFWSHDFVVKVDADSIFFPDRLRPRVQVHVGQPVYFGNCPKGHGTMLYGAIEVFSVPALAAYRDRGEECKKKLPWKGWSEDFYMDNCMSMLGVQGVMDSNQVGDKNCIAAPCSDSTKVAFHPFKDLESWEQCLRMAIGDL